MYNIPAENIDSLEAKLEKLSKRAAKLGLVGPSLTIVGEHLEERNDEIWGKSYFKVFEVEVDPGEDIIIAGWKLAAKIEHEPNGNIVKSLVELDPKWRTAEPNCEHCNLNRNRAVTYILTNDGVEKQVGSTCLVDFTGHKDAEALAEYHSYLDEFLGNAESEYGYDPDAAYKSNYLKVKQYLEYAALSVRKFGYVSRKKSELEMKVATAEDAITWMTKKHGHEYPNEEDKALAKNTIAYAKALDPQNDFEHNVKVLLSDEYVHVRNIGYVAGALSAYIRTVEDSLKGEGKEYIGTIGKREDFSLVLAAVKVIDGYYGETYLYTFSDENGNTVIWFSSKNKKLERGTEYTIKGTVKEHKEYRGIPQTVLTRCKVQ